MLYYAKFMKSDLPFSYYKLLPFFVVAILLAACSRTSDTEAVPGGAAGVAKPPVPLPNLAKDLGTIKSPHPVTAASEAKQKPVSLHKTSKGAEFYLSIGKLSEEELKALLAENLSLEQRRTVLNRYAFILGQRSTSELVGWLNTLDVSDLAGSAATTGAQSTAQRQGANLATTLSASAMITDERIRSGFIRGALTAGATSDLPNALTLGAKYRDQLTAHDYNELLSDSFASARLNGQFGDLVNKLTDTDYRLVSQPGLADEFAQWSTENHADALAVLNGIPKDDFTAPLYYGFAREWAGSDISGALNWVSQQQDGPARDRAVAGLVLHLRNENVQQAVEMAETIKDKAWRDYSIQAAKDVSFVGTIPGGDVE